MRRKFLFLLPSLNLLPWWWFLRRIAAFEIHAFFYAIGGIVSTDVFVMDAAAMQIAGRCSWVSTVGYCPWYIGMIGLTRAATYVPFLAMKELVLRFCEVISYTLFDRFRCLFCAQTGGAGRGAGRFTRIPRRVLATATWLARGAIRAADATNATNTARSARDSPPGTAFHRIIEMYLLVAVGIPRLHRSVV